MAQYIEAAKLPLQQRYKAIKQLNSKVKEKSSILLFTNIYAHEYSVYNEIEWDIIEQLQTVHVEIAVKRYCLANDNPPDTLEDIIPVYLEEIPIDPFGNEIKYKK